MEAGEPHLVVGVSSLCLADQHGGLAVLYSLSTNAVTATAHCGTLNWFTCDGATGAEKELWAAIDGCLAGAGATYADVAAICACVAVRDAHADLEDLRATLAKKLPERTLVLVHTDAAAALASCTQGVLHGACVVADKHTEAAAYTNGGDRSHRTSGWGPLFMDGGCAYDIGARALLAALKAHDGRGASTTVTRAFLRRLQLQRPEDLVRWAYHPPEGREERVGGLARVVVECAMSGDAVADTILRHGVGELLRAVKTAAAAVRLGGSPFKVALAGRLLQEAGLYSHYLAEAIREQVPGADICFPESEPAEAAALLALRALAQARGQPQPQQPLHG